MADIKWKGQTGSLQTELMYTSVHVSLSLLFSILCLPSFFPSFNQPAFSRIVLPSKPGPAQGLFLLKGSLSVPLEQDDC